MLLDIPDGVHLVDELVRADLVLVEPPVGVRLHRELERLTGRLVDESDLQERFKSVINRSFREMTLMRDLPHKI